MRSRAFLGVAEDFIGLSQGLRRGRSLALWRPNAVEPREQSFPVRPRFSAARSSRPPPGGWCFFARGNSGPRTDRAAWLGSRRRSRHPARARWFPTCGCAPSPGWRERGGNKAPDPPTSSRGASPVEPSEPGRAGVAAPSSGLPRPRGSSRLARSDGAGGACPPPPQILPGHRGQWSIFGNSLSLPASILWALDCGHRDT